VKNTLLALALLAAVSLCRDALSFDFDDVDRRAKQLAEAAYVKPEGEQPKELRISYDQYRDIRYKRERFLWSGALPFEVAFFHPGWLYEHPVRIHEVSGGRASEIRFDPSAFDYGKTKLDPEKLRAPGLGFAGFRVHYPINTQKYKDEVLVFLGASYFRAVGKWQLYGLSARGLAIDTALASGEEFPRFTEFWIERPGANATQLVIYALLDSKRITGAYRFTVRPGVETVLDVKARLYQREKVGKLGIAPLTSMYAFGENHRPAREDFRPEVHDSDGLLMRSGTEWLWRPLVNPRRLLVTSFAFPTLTGFGLMQRDRDFAHYEDLEARYEMRPSAWVEPVDEWGPGRVELVQIPSPDETNDNIVAFWVPDKVPAPREPFDLEYRVRWQKETETRPPHAWVLQSRRGHGGNVRKPDNTVSFSVDFAGPALRGLGTAAKVEPVITLDSNVQLVEKDAFANHVTGGWRMTLRVRRLDEAKPAELRAFLRAGNEPVSEVWSYVLPAN
jgi:glucans biosynthesis protein